MGDTALLKHCLGMLAAAAVVVGVAPAQAELVRFVNPTPVAGCAANPSLNCTSSVDIGALGFGAAPRMLTLQSTGTETSQVGASVPTAIDPDQATGQAIVGANKTEARTLGELGWIGASQFAIAYDSDQSGIDRHHTQRTDAEPLQRRRYYDHIQRQPR